MQLNKIQHIGIPVTDLGKSVPFYQRLGFEAAMESPFDYQGERGTCVMMKQGEILIELYQFPARFLPEIRNRKDGPVDHIAFDVQDIDLVFSGMKARGFNPIEESPVFLPFWKNGCRYFYILGPDGERLEFNQIL
ncbi:MAG TPA: VOC family protein [Saprospiraceae bacterium]|nr:VOC family protein [Saprospiraceae bacterium]HNT21553.1 VOC family protein [Saprospiraceae bacterium]